MNVFQSLSYRFPLKPDLRLKNLDIPIGCLLYYLLGKVGIWATISPSFGSTIWPASGFAIAFILLRGGRVSIGIFVGAFFLTFNNASVKYLDVSHSILFSVSSLCALGATLEAILGARLIRRFLGTQYSYEHFQGIFLFVFLSAVSCIIAALFGTASAWTAGMTAENSFFEVFFRWWFGDLVGILVIAPLIVVGYSTKSRLHHTKAVLSKTRYYEALVTLLLLLGTGYAIFINNQWMAPHSIDRLESILLLFVLWSSFRYEQWGAVVCTFLIAVICLVGATQSAGPFAKGDLQDSLLLSQIFVSICAISGLVIAGLNSERRLAEEKLRTSANDLADFFDHSSIGMHLSSSDGKILRANNYEMHMLGYTPDEYLGKCEGEIFEDLGVLDRIVTALSRGEVVHNIQTKMRTKDGTCRYVIVSATGLLKNNRLVRRQMLIKDISAYHESEEIRSYLADIVESSGDAIASGTLSGMVSTWNPGAEKIFGYTADEIIGKPASILFPPECRNQLRINLEKLARGEKIELLEERRLRKDGTEVTVWVNLSPVRNRDGKITGVSVISRDISELVRSRKLLAKVTSELERSNSVLKDFAFAASHDLREPLRTVSTFLQLIEKSTNGRLDQTSRDYINFAVGGAKRMSRLIEGLLNYSTVGSSVKVTRETDLNEILKNALEDLKASTHEANAKVSWKNLPTVWVDPIQMSRLFQNLIGNALKFRKGQPAEIEIAASRNDREWIFVVKDNGIGIHADHFDRIFGIFKRLHPPDEFPGAGVGLAICRTIVEQHGGQMWVESALDQGSRFYFSLPFERSVTSPRLANVQAESL